MFELGVEADVLWAAVADALLEELRPTGSVITVREQGRCALRLEDDLRDSPDHFQGNSGMGSNRATTAAARAWTCDSDKLRDNITSGLCRGVNGVSSLKSALVGEDVDCSGGRTAGKR